MNTTAVEFIKKVEVAKPGDYPIDIVLRKPVAEILKADLSHFACEFINRCPRTLPPDVISIVEEFYPTKEDVVDYIVRRVSKHDGLVITHLLRRYEPIS